MWASPAGIAQHGAGGELEVPVDPDQKAPKMIPMRGEGVVLLCEAMQGPSADSLYIALVFYDTLLQEKWKRSVGYSKRLALTQYDYQTNQLFLVFQNAYRSTLQVTQIDLAGRVRNHVIGYLKHFKITDFTVLENNVYLVGELKGVSIAVVLNLQNDRMSPVPLALLSKHVEVKRVYPNKEFVNLVISVEQNKQKSIVVREIDKNGNRRNDYQIDPQPEYDLLDGRLSYLPDGERVVMGTYTLRKSDNTQGLYFSKFHNEELLFTEYFSFTSFKNFFGYLGEEKQAEVMEEMMRNEEKGKPLGLKYRLLLHDLIKQDDRYFMVGEAYYPTYRVVRKKNSFGRRHFPDKQTIFNGYRHTHAVVASIHESGQLRWDRSLKMQDIKLFKLKPQVNILPRDENVYLVYNMAGNIRQVQITSNDEVLLQEPMVLAAGFRNNPISYKSRGAEYWYGNHFLFSGFRKNVENATGKREDVFYINKVSF